MKKITMFRVGISLIPILILVTLLALNISIFGSDAILGASQVALLFSAGVAIWLAMWLFKVPWQDFEETIKSNIGDVTTAIVILFLIGAISGTWTVSGIVPTFIYYGVKIISPHGLHHLRVGLRHDRKFLDDNSNNRSSLARNRESLGIQRRNDCRSYHLRSLLRGQDLTSL